METVNIRINDFVDNMNEGLIAIDNKGIISTYNSKAKDMIGARRNCMYPHASGKLNKGDIVILAYSSFKSDVGGVDEADLKSIGIDLVNVEKGSTVLAVGQYLEGSQGKYKIKEPDHKLDEFMMQEEFNQISFESKINYIERFVEITYSGNNYRYYYNNYFNHTLVVNPISKTLKFYQLGGYTLWKEDLKDLMAGLTFHEKSVGYHELKLLGSHLSTFHKESEIINEFIACAKGDKDGYSNKNGLINGINVMSTLQPIKRNEQVVGAYLLISDITRLQIAENQKNLAFKKLADANAALSKFNDNDVYFTNIIGSSKKLLNIKQLAFKASRYRSNVLILGESGTGKSILARVIHEASEVSMNPFVQVNCSSIPESLIESELFGYDKGAFTGASNKGKKGYFELADKGTIFLDEIGDLSKSMQVKLLHVIQNRSFYRVGGDKEIKVNVRIIVATNRNLKKDVRDGIFREDLYYRVNVFPIKIPPLRERSDDIHELVDYLLPKICKRVGTKLVGISAEALDKMMMYSWPGNIRELENVLERAVNLCDGGKIVVEHIKIKVTKKNLFNQDIYLKPLKETLFNIELEIIKNVLNYTDGNKKKAMEILKIKKTKLYESVKLIEKS